MKYSKNMLFETSFDVKKRIDDVIFFHRLVLLIAWKHFTLK